MLATETVNLTIGVANTAGMQREVTMSFTLVPGLSRNLLYSSPVIANGVETIISASPGLRETGEHFPLKTDRNLYFLDVILPELPSEYANVRETSNVMLWHRRIGHINARRVKKLAEEKTTGMVVKHTDLSVSK